MFYPLFALPSRDNTVNHVDAPPPLPPFLAVVYLDLKAAMIYLNLLYHAFIFSSHSRVLNPRFPMCSVALVMHPSPKSKGIQENQPFSEYLSTYTYRSQDTPGISLR